MGKSGSDMVQAVGNPGTVHLKPASLSGGAEVRHDLGNRINTFRNGSSRLDNNARSIFESRFGVDFSNVRIHAGSDAAQLARDLSAKAFTLGNDIFFGNGQYDPGSEGGRHLLAHELAHVLQHPVTGGGATIHRRIDPNARPSSDPLPPLSEEAQSLMDKINQISLRVYEKELPYTDGTVRAVEGVVRSMWFGILKLEGIQVFQRTHPGLGSPIPVVTHHFTQSTRPLRRPARAHNVMDLYIDLINRELDRDPKEDEFQEGNILGLWRRFNDDFKNAYELEEFIESLQDQMRDSEPQPGDYPLPPSGSESQVA
jgi:hypothetical protein